MGTDHEKTIRDYLDTNAGLSVEIFAGGFRPKMDDDAIAVRQLDGFDPQYKYGAPSEVKFPEVKVLVRAPFNDRAGAKLRADTVWDTLSGAEPPGYLAVYMRGSGPNAAGRDGHKRWIFSVRAEPMLDE